MSSKTRRLLHDLREWLSAEAEPKIAVVVAVGERPRPFEADAHGGVERIVVAAGPGGEAPQAAQHGQKGSDVFASHRSAPAGAPEIFFDLCKGPPPSGNPLTEKISKRRLVFRRRERGYKNFRRPKLPHYCGKTINNQADLFTFSCGQRASFVDTFRAAVSKVRAAPAKPSGFSTPRGLRAVHISADNQPIAAGLTARAFVVGRKRRKGPLAVEKSPAAGRHGKKTPA